MRTPLLAVPLTAALALGACGGDGKGGKDYSKEYGKAKQVFLDACERVPNADADACECVFAKIEQTIPYPDFKAADDAVSAGRKADAGTLSKISDITASCRK